MSAETHEIEVPNGRQEDMMAMAALIPRVIADGMVPTPDEIADMVALSSQYQVALAATTSLGDLLVRMASYDREGPASRAALVDENMQAKRDLRSLLGECQILPSPQPTPTASSSSSSSIECPRGPTPAEVAQLASLALEYNAIMEETSLLNNRVMQLLSRGVGPPMNPTSDTESTCSGCPSEAGSRDCDTIVADDIDDSCPGKLEIFWEFAD